MIERGEELNVAATEAELPLAAAVGADPVRLAVVVGREEAFHRAEPRRLDVHGPRLPRQRLDVLDRVDDGVPGHSVAVRLEHGDRLLGEAWILEPRAGQALGDAAVEVRVGRRVDTGSPLLAL